MNRRDRLRDGLLGMPLLPGAASQATDSRRGDSDPIRPYPSHVRILEVKHQFEDYKYRTPY